MRALTLFFAALLLVQTGFAAACHNVGDVHVICHNDGIETVYVETGTLADKQIADKECCTALSFFDETPAHFTPAPTRLIKAAKPPHTDFIAAHQTPTPPNRGPPASAAL